MQNLMHSIISRFPPVLGLVVMCGCTGDSSSASTSAIVRDSASIAIVENSSPVWPENKGWRLSDEPITTIGMVEGPPEYQFHDVMGVFLSSAGTVVVGDMGSSQIRFFDSSGRHLRTAGRNGSGPGEIGQLMQIIGFRGDSILVVDGGGPVHFFADDGEYASSYTPPSETPFFPRPAGHLADGRIVMLMTGAFPQRLTEPVTLTYAPALLQRPELRLDTITVLESGTFHPGWNGSSTRTLFGPLSLIAILSDGIVAGTSDRFELRRFDADGRLTRIIRRSWTPSAVPPDLRARYAEQYVNGAGEDGGSVPERLRVQRQAVLDARPVASTLPAYTRLMTDSEDNVWVRETDPEHLITPQSGWHRLDTTPGSWNVFDPEGTWLGVVETPANFVVMDIGADYVAGLTRDDLGVEMVNVYALSK